MSELLAFGTLGFQHIIDARGADHIVFLLALAAIYRFRDWRECLWVVTAFPVGHSLTLALAVTGTLRVPSALIEFLIPVTILMTALESLLVRDGQTAAWGRRYRPVFAGVFGLVHGAGFANYLRSLFVDDIATPLLGFNVGLEIGQLLVITMAFVTFGTVDRLICAIVDPAPSANGDRAVRLRALAVSVLVMGVSARWTLERIPW